MSIRTKRENTRFPKSTTITIECLSPPRHLSQRLAVDVDLVVHVQLVVLQEAAPLGVGPLDLAEEATELLQFAQK